MRTPTKHVRVAIVLLGSLLSSIAFGQTPTTRIDEALQNITTLTRTGKIGYATIWDGNKFVQCKRMDNRDLRCEAAGSMLQPSLQKVLTGTRLERLMSLGWKIDPSFGNFVQTFPADLPTSVAADRISKVLLEGYDADTSKLELNTAWILDVPCPPRAGLSQNLAGSVNDAPSMRLRVIRGCSYTPDSKSPQIADSLNELIAIHGPKVTAEIQRLRINAARRVFAIFDAGIGYIQCAPDAVDREFYCEAQSAESWPALATVLTPARVSYLKDAGFSEPGRAPNYWKTYAFDKFSNAEIAKELLSILYEVYGYRGNVELKITAP